MALGLNRRIWRRRRRPLQLFDQILWKAVTLANSTFLPAYAEFVRQRVAKELIEHLGRAGRIAATLGCPGVVRSQECLIPLP